MYEKCHLVYKHSPLTLSAVVKLGKSATQRMENIHLQQVKVHSLNEGDFANFTETITITAITHLQVRELPFFPFDWWLPYGC